MAGAAAALTALAAGLDGTVVRPGEPGFDAVRKPFVGTWTDRLPAAVVRCAGAADVATALEFARRHELPFAVRSGGHSFAEWSSTTGLLIDLSALAEIRPHGDHVVVGPGVRLGGLAAGLAAVDRLVPVGWCPDVGVGGAVLGGGYGVFGRLYGLGADHLTAARVLLADGRSVRCDETHEPELFWASRGAGGGLFGVVTSFELRTRPVLPATAFEYTWSYPDAAAVVDAWQRAAPGAPDEVNAELALTATDDPGEEPYLTVFGVAVGGATAFLDRLPTPRTVSLTDLAPRAAACHSAYPGESDDVIVSGPPPDAPPGLRLVRSGFRAADLSPVEVGELVARFGRDRRRGEFRDVEFVPWGGAIGRVPPDATAFAHRAARFMVKHTVQVSHRAGEDRRRAAADWLAAAWEPVGALTTGIYPNYADPAVPPWDRAYHGANLDRLRAVKRRYDPGNVFRLGPVA